MDSVIQILKDTFSLLALPKMTFIDIVEIFIIAFSLYHIIFLGKENKSMDATQGNCCIKFDLSGSLFP